MSTLTFVIIKVEKKTQIPELLYCFYLNFTLYL